MRRHQLEVWRRWASRRVKDRCSTPSSRNTPCLSPSPRPSRRQTPDSRRRGSHLEDLEVRGTNILQPVVWTINLPRYPAIFDLSPAPQLDEDADPLDAPPPRELNGRNGFLKPFSPSSRLISTDGWSLLSSTLAPTVRHVVRQRSSVAALFFRGAGPGTRLAFRDRF